MSNPNDKKSDTKSDIAAAVEAALKEALPLATMAAVQAMRGGPAPSQADLDKAAQERVKGEANCIECRQKVKTCKNKHRSLVVYPLREEFADFFPGVIINGVTYLSNGPGHAISVPAESDIESILQGFETQEIINTKGRKKQRKSAQLSPNGSHFNPAPVSWE